jgi:tetratricopeptide (TPR) repeat protein
VLADAARHSLDPEGFHDASLPFPGRWIERPNRPIPLGLALDLMDEGALDDAREFVARVGSDLAKHREFSTLMAWIGDGLMTRGDTQAALEAYETALATDGSSLVVLNNLAWQRATHSDEKVRDGPAAVRWAEKAADLSKHRDPSVLDTLAAAYAQAGRFKAAVATAEHALSLTQSQDQPAVRESLLKGLGFYRRGRAYGR